ncbi:MAG TPA: response regulator [Ktedonobacteraceae bacterium]|nr:response regulator [Ktedonobacteraceae bacterium]
MTHEQLASTSTILLIEADPSLRRLMTLGLQHSGMHVIEACSLESLAPVTTQSLDLLVLDINLGMTSDWSLLEKIQSNPHLASLPIVVLTWDHPLLDSTSSTTTFSPSTSEASMVAATDSQVILLAKPFDARALYRTIQHLLASRAAQKAAMEALAEARVLALYSQHAAPSIWPVVTAAGLLLAVVGLLLHVIIAITGILLVVVALLLWTLGAKPEAAPMAIAALK